MIYGFAMLLLLLSGVTGIPALRALRRMRDINRRAAETPGMVSSSKSAMGWLWTAGFGNQDRPLVTYRPPNSEEMMLQVHTSSILPKRRYEIGQAVTVVYDTLITGEAYVKNEWDVAVRDLWLAAAALAGAALLTGLGLLLSLP